jgi:hypothetical protein
MPDQIFDDDDDAVVVPVDVTVGDPVEEISMEVSDEAPGCSKDVTSRQGMTILSGSVQQLAGQSFLTTDEVATQGAIDEETFQIGGEQYTLEAMLAGGADVGGRVGRHSGLYE